MLCIYLNLSVSFLAVPVYLTWPHHRLTAHCMFTCVPVGVNSLMKAAVGCRNIWITAWVFWLAQWINQYHKLGSKANGNDRVHFYCAHLSNLCSTASNFHLVLTLLQRSVKASSSRTFAVPHIPSPDYVYITKEVSLLLYARFRWQLCANYRSRSLCLLKESPTISMVTLKGTFHSVNSSEKCRHSGVVSSDILSCHWWWRGNNLTTTSDIIGT